MSKNKQKQKNVNNGLAMIAIVLIILTTVFSSIGYYAWAKYSSSMPGDAVAQVARWNFSMRAGEEKTTPETPFAITRTDGYGHVVEATLAPGTFGEIPVFIDMTRTEVLTKLELTFTITDCPRNIKFYASEADRTNNKPMKYTQTMDENNKYVTTVTVKKYYSIEDENADDYVGKVHNETIYWKWAYETLDSENSPTAGDEKDKEDSGKKAQIVITARATEVLEKALTLGDVDIKVGDTINYTNGNTKIRGIVVNKTDSLVEFMPVDNLDIAKTVGSIQLGNKTGLYSFSETDANDAIDSWNNAVQLLDKEAKKGFNNVYGFDGASRALAVEDVNRLVGYTPDTSIVQRTYSGTPTSSNIQRFIVDELTEVRTQNGTKLATELEGIDVGDTVKITGTYGGETVQSVTIKSEICYIYGGSSTYPLSKYFSTIRFWLASRSINPQNVCTYYVRICSSSNGVNCDGLYCSEGSSMGISHSVVPVVSLTSNTHVEAGATRGVWEVNE